MRVCTTACVVRGVVLGVLLLGVAACGEPAVPGASPSQPEGGANPATSVGTPSSTPIPTTPARESEVTVSGVVIEGLRPTCRVLQTPSKRLALVGPGAAELKEGDRVTVTGVEQPGAHNPCGETFVVTHVRTTTAGG